MSSKFYLLPGNRNRQGIPLQRQIKRLLCISKKIYERLKAEVNLIYKRKEEKIRDIQMEAPPSEKKAKKEVKVLSSEYEPSNIWETRDSPLWQWRRVKEWFSQFSEPNFLLNQKYDALHQGYLIRNPEGV